MFWSLKAKRTLLSKLVIRAAEFPDKSQRTSLCTCTRQLRVHQWLQRRPPWLDTVMAFRYQDFTRGWQLKIFRFDKLFLKCSIFFQIFSRRFVTKFFWWLRDRRHHLLEEAYARVGRALARLQQDLDQTIQVVNPGSRLDRSSIKHESALSS